MYNLQEKYTCSTCQKSKLKRLNNKCLNCQKFKSCIHKSTGCTEAKEIREYYQLQSNKLTHKTNCNICLKVFGNLTNLEKHKKLEHVNNMKKIWCKLCRKKFSSYKGLSKHQNSSIEHYYKQFQQ